MLADILFVEASPTYKIRTKYVAPFYGSLADLGSIPCASTILEKIKKQPIAVAFLFSFNKFSFDSPHYYSEAELNEINILPMLLYEMEFDLHTLKNSSRKSL